MTVVVKLRYTNKDWTDWLTEGRAFSLQVWRWLRFTGDKWDKKQLFSLPLLWPLIFFDWLTWLRSTCDHCAPSLVNKSRQSTHRQSTDCISVHIHFSHGGNCWHSDSRPGIWQICDSCAPTISKPETDYWPFPHSFFFFFFLMSHASKLSLAKYRSTYLQIKINTAASLRMSLNTVRLLHIKQNSHSRVYSLTVHTTNWGS